MLNREKIVLFIIGMLIFICFLGAPVSAAQSQSTGISIHAGPVDQSTGIKSVGVQNDLQRYIVLLTDQPLALYSGGIKGLKATSLQATGARKLDVSGPDSQAYLQHLNTKQAAALSNIGRVLGESPEVFQRYQTVLNGFCLKMTATQAKRVSGLAGVKKVLPDVERHALTDAGPVFIGAGEAWSGTWGLAATKGEGIVVGIIDTGINPSNPSFADVGGDAYDHNNPRGQYYGVCNGSHPFYDSSFPCNDKLIGAYDFARDTGDAYITIDDEGHGSHTASTVAGNSITAVMPVKGGTVLPVSRQISGVAPHANIISYRGLRGGSGYSSWLAAAIEQATVDGVDVINYSIGGTSFDPWSRLDSLAFLAARDAGVFVAVSAGNSGPDGETVGAPGDSPWVLTVGSSTHDRTFLGQLTDLTSSGVSMSDIEGMSISGAYGPTNIVYAGDYDNGETDPGLCDADFAAGTFNGAIVVCDRGYSGMETRLAKAEHVMAGGAGGMVIANGADMADSVTAMNFELPGISISYQHGEALKAWLSTGSAHQAAIAQYSVRENDNAQADRLAGYSSRGPNPSVPRVMKPDVCAPGENIYAAYGANDAVEYGVLIGTSMASPHAAGAAALLKAARPDLSPAEIQSALVSTALNTSIKKEDSTTSADPFDMGGGRVDVSRAVKAALVLNETKENYQNACPYIGGDPSTLNLATLTHDDVVVHHTFTRTLRSTLAQVSTWEATIDNPSGTVVTVTPNPFTIPAGGTQQIEIKVTNDGAPLDTWVFGQVSLDSVGQMSVGMPLAIKYGDSTLDENLRYEGVSKDGSATIDVRASIDAPEFSAEVFGMVPGYFFQEDVYQDPTPGDYGDDPTPAGGVLTIEATLNVTFQRLVAEIAQTSSPDVDIHIYYLEGDSWVCHSAKDGNDEYCNIDSPPIGTYYILYQNWQATDTTGTNPDLIEAVVGVVSDASANNLNITANVPSNPTRTAITAGQDFELLLDWTLEETPRYWYGAFNIGTDPSHPDNLGHANIDVVFAVPGDNNDSSGCFIETAE